MIEPAAAAAPAIELIAEPKIATLRASCCGRHKRYALLAASVTSRPRLAP